jgi:hypothetical protein
MSAPDLAYLDTSFYLGFLLGAPKALALKGRIQRKRLCSSVLLLAEAERNVIRLGREGDLSTHQYQAVLDRIKEDRERFLLRDVTLDLCHSGVYPPIRLPRTLDLLHLRTAALFHAEQGLDAFLTLDESQRAAAGDLKLPVPD